MEVLLSRAVACDLMNKAFHPDSDTTWMVDWMFSFELIAVFTFSIFTLSLSMCRNFSGTVSHCRPSSGSTLFPRVPVAALSFLDHIPYSEL